MLLFADLNFGLGNWKSPLFHKRQSGKVPWKKNRCFIINQGHISSTNDDLFTRLEACIILRARPGHNNKLILPRGSATNKRNGHVPVYTRINMIITQAGLKTVEDTRGTRLPHPVNWVFLFRGVLCPGSRRIKVSCVYSPRPE